MFDSKVKAPVSKKRDFTPTDFHTIYLTKIEENLEQMLNMNTSNLGENGYQYAKKYLVVDKVVDDILKELHRVEGI